MSSAAEDDDNEPAALISPKDGAGKPHLAASFLGATSSTVDPVQQSTLYSSGAPWSPSSPWPSLLGGTLGAQWPSVDESQEWPSALNATGRWPERQETRIVPGACVSSPLSSELTSAEVSAEQSLAEQSIAEQSLAEQSLAGESLVEQSLAEHCLAEQSLAEQNIAEQSLAYQSLADQSSACEQSSILEEQEPTAQLCSAPVSPISSLATPASLDSVAKHASRPSSFSCRSSVVAASPSPASSEEDRSGIYSARSLEALAMDVSVVSDMPSHDLAADVKGVPDLPSARPSSRESSAIGAEELTKLCVDAPSVASRQPSLKPPPAVSPSAMSSSRAMSSVAASSTVGRPSPSSAKLVAAASQLAQTLGLERGSRASTPSALSSRESLVTAVAARVAQVHDAGSRSGTPSVASSRAASVAVASQLARAHCALLMDLHQTVTPSSPLSASGTVSATVDSGISTPRVKLGEQLSVEALSDLALTFLTPRTCPPLAISHPVMEALPRPSSADPEVVSDRLKQRALLALSHGRIDGSLHRALSALFPQQEAEESSPPSAPADSSGQRRLPESPQTSSVSRGASVSTSVAAVQEEEEEQVALTSLEVSPFPWLPFLCGLPRGLGEPGKAASARSHSDVTLAPSSTVGDAVQSCAESTYSERIVLRLWNEEADLGPEALAREVAWEGLTALQDLASSAPSTARTSASQARILERSLQMVDEAMQEAVQLAAADEVAAKKMAAVEAANDEWMSEHRRPKRSQPPAGQTLDVLGTAGDAGGDTASQVREDEQGIAAEPPSPASPLGAKEATLPDLSDAAMSTEGSGSVGVRDLLPLVAVVPAQRPPSDAWMEPEQAPLGSPTGCSRARSVATCGTWEEFLVDAATGKELQGLQDKSLYVPRAKPIQPSEGEVGSSLHSLGLPSSLPTGVDPSEAGVASSVLSPPASLPAKGQQDGVAPEPSEPEGPSEVGRSSRTAESACRPSSGLTGTRLSEVEEHTAADELTAADLIRGAVGDLPPLPADADFSEIENESMGEVVGNIVGTLRLESSAGEVEMSEEDCEVSVTSKSAAPGPPFEPGGVAEPKLGTDSVASGSQRSEEDVAALTAEWPPWSPACQDEVDALAAGWMPAQQLLGTRAPSLSLGGSSIAADSHAAVSAPSSAPSAVPPSEGQLTAADLARGTVPSVDVDLLEPENGSAVEPSTILETVRTASLPDRPMSAALRPVSTNGASTRATSAGSATALARPLSALLRPTSGTSASLAPCSEVEEAMSDLEGSDVAEGQLAKDTMGLLNQNDNSGSCSSAGGSTHDSLAALVSPARDWASQLAVAATHAARDQQEAPVERSASLEKLPSSLLTVHEGPDSPGRLAPDDREAPARPAVHAVAAVSDGAKRLDGAPEERQASHASSGAASGPQEAAERRRSSLSVPQPPDAPAVAPEQRVLSERLPSKPVHRPPGRLAPLSRGASYSSSSPSLGRSAADVAEQKVVVEARRICRLTVHRVVSPPEIYRDYKPLGCLAEQEHDFRPHMDVLLQKRASMRRSIYHALPSKPPPEIPWRVPREPMGKSPSYTRSAPRLLPSLESSSQAPACPSTPEMQELASTYRQGRWRPQKTKGSGYELLKKLRDGALPGILVPPPA